MEAKGKKFLKVCGVLFLIEGIIGILAYGVMTLLLGTESIIAKSAGGGEVTAIAAMYLIASVVSLVAGILGVKCNSVKNAGSKCLVWGIINLLLTFAAGVWSSGGADGSYLHYVYSSAIIVIPSLYVVGAYMIKE